MARYESRSTILETEGRKLVRRFTDELEGVTDLEKATKKAQIKQDDDTESVERVRVQRIVDSIDENADTDFSAAAAAGRALGQMTDKFAEETKLAKSGRWTFRKSTKIKANELLSDPTIRDFGELQAMVTSLDDKWKSQNGPVYGYFQRLCKTLDNHKAVFKIFPSQNTYAAVLCGSLAMIVQASVNQDAVPEFLSKVVAEISEEAALCAQLVDIVREKGLQERLADVYARLFKFYRDVMAWYLKSKPSKFISSFNEGLKDLFKDAVGEIRESIAKLRWEGENISHYKLNVILREMGDMKHELFRQRQTSQGDPQVGPEGLNMLRDTLLGIYAKLERQEERFHRLEQDVTVSTSQSQRQLDGFVVEDQDFVTGQQLRRYSDKLNTVIVGDEGQKFFDQGMFWLTDGITVSKLADWMTAKPDSQTLWISSSQTTTSSGRVSGAKAAALSAIASAWEAEKPVISHFCERPHHKNVAKGLTVEEAGLLGITYSLINQLQQFVPDEESVDIPKGSLQSLDGSKGSWQISLTVLRALLRQTPQLSYCVIYGLNELEWAGGAEWCEELLDVLWEHQEKQPFSVLLTTTGQSRFLSRAIKPAERHMAMGMPREVRIRKTAGPMVYGVGGV